MNLLPAALSKHLKQLREIYVQSCMEMKAVFPPENDGIRSGETKNVAFQSLVTVWLKDLPNMVTFVWTKGGDAIYFPSMEDLCVDKCPMMRSFSLLKEDESAHDELCFFDNKVHLPKLARLYLISLRSIQKIWHEEILEESFCQLEKVFVVDCHALVDVIPSVNMTTIGIGRLQFHNLKIICIRECRSLEGPIFKCAVEEEETGNKEYTHKGHYYSMSKLKMLRLHELPKLEHVVQPDSHVVVGFPSLVQITVTDCECIIDLFPIATAGTLSELKDLKIVRCNSMRQVFGKYEEEEEEGEMLDSIVFPRLHSIVVQDLDSLISFFSGISCMLGFPTLEVLDISRCSKLKTFVQRHTNDLTLEPSSPFAKQHSVHHYLFDDKVVFPNLKKVELEELSTLQSVWKTKLPCLNICDRIGQITEISIWKCEMLEEIIFESDENAAGGETIKTTKDDTSVFHSLTSVELGNLDSMVAFIRGGRRDQSINFPSLKELYVDNCPKMRAFYLPPNTEESGGESLLPLGSFFDHKVIVPKVVKLELIFMGSIEKIWEHEAIFEESFFQLESLIVKNCHNLVKVFPSKYVTRTQRLLLFQNLKEIIIRKCSSLEGSLFEFVWDKGEAELGKQVFSLPLQLEKLWLFNLPKLEHVIHPTSDVVLEFQSLVEISIADCQCLTDLFPSTTVATLSKLEEVQILRCSSMRYVFGKEEEKEDEILLDFIISFPCLRTICVQQMNSLICFFLGTTRQLDFLSLENLEISCCPVLKTFVQIHKGKDIHYYLFDDKVQFPNLQKMTLYQLSSLQTIWKNDRLLPSSDSCSRLKSLTVARCKDLQHIIPVSFASNLARLEELHIYSCEAVEEVVIHGDDYGISEELDGTNSSHLFFFPHLTSLELNDLPNLRSIYRGSNVSTWSALKKVWMWHCDKVQIFTTTKFSSENSSTRQSLFSAKQVIPRLEILTLVEEDVIMIQEGEIKEDIFAELKHLSLACFHSERAAAFPLRFLLEKHFQKLESLDVFCSSFEEIFADESLSPQEIISYKERFAFPGEGIEKTLAKLKEIKLSKLHNLKHVWRADMTVFAEILKSIQLLEVTNCPDLKNLFPTESCSFGNITTIKVHYCDGMKELVTSSAATSLVKLTQLDIYDCGMIETIVSLDGSKTAEEEEDGELLVICFRELKHIGLHRLPRLTSFSSAMCNFEFPSLVEITVKKCPNMNVFSSSIIAAPKLSTVLLTKKEKKGQVRWDGDLNTTIHNIWRSS